MSPDDLKYTKAHEWARVDDGGVVVGITDYAQSELGDITFLEFPEIGHEVAKGDELAVVESVKAASDIFAPVGGQVASVNTLLEESPETVNSDPYGDGWICRLTGCDESELDSLMSAEEYDKYVKSLK
jgi:glycine cleavage system H protein